MNGGPEQQPPGDALNAVPQQDLKGMDRAATWIVDNQGLLKIVGAGFALFITWTERRKLRATISRLESKIDSKLRRRKG